MAFNEKMTMKVACLQKITCQSAGVTASSPTLCWRWDNKKRSAKANSDED